MKSGIIFSSLVVILLTFVSSCKQDIDLTGDAQETAVVYALLNQSDSIHYFKINRAFLSNDNSLVTAQIPDSNYFNSVEATVKEVVNGTVTRTWTLQDTILTDKKPGVFYAPEQKVYYFTTTSAAPLIANSSTEYQMDIDINEGEFSVSGVTKLIKDMEITSPSNTSAYSFASMNGSTVVYNTPKVIFKKGDSKVMDATLRVAFEEYIGTDVTVKTFDWKIATLDAPQLNESQVNVNVNGKTFYTLIAENATDNPAITKRKLKYINLIVTGGSEDLQKYMSVTEPSSSLAQNKPTYTNMTATNGRKVVGIFSARHSLERSKNDFTHTSGSFYTTAISKPSMKELATGSITGSLMFCSSNPTYQAPTLEPYYCP